jgi:phosphopantothenoylcysteine decarboxylase / phosphopantothenate---cysteine ligase
MLNGKNVLIGITGGIAAYKVCDLIRMFKKANANVKVIATQNALNFVTRLTLQTLSQNPVYIEQFDVEEYKPGHISLADEADIFIIAPASANTISKLATGICDNLLTSVACAFKKPILIAPAMNCNMWDNPIIQENLDKLEGFGYHILNPEEGFLACGYNGNGRLCEIEKIYDKTVETLESKKKLVGKKVVITAGGTKEKIDSVRFISNFSSGKMGFALADEAFNQGAEVVLITTVCPPNSLGTNVIDASPQLPRPLREREVFQHEERVLEKRVRGTICTEIVESALDMKEAVEREFKDADCLIMAAAVADYRAKEIAPNKIKKTSAEEISIDLIKNPDILAEISRGKENNQIVVGFCAESENVLENAKEKITKKDCDFLVANDISRSDIGFASDYNEVHILDKSGNIEKIEKATKKQIAKKIFEIIF